MFSRSTNRNQDGRDQRYFSVVENRRLPGDKTVLKTVLYPGETNDQRQADTVTGPSREVRLNCAQAVRQDDEPCVTEIQVPVESSQEATQ